MLLALSVVRVSTGHSHVNMLTQALPPQEEHIFPFCGSVSSYQQKWRKSKTGLTTLHAAVGQIVRRIFGTASAKVLIGKSLASTSKLKRGPSKISVNLSGQSSSLSMLPVAVTGEQRALPRTRGKRRGRSFEVLSVLLLISLSSGHAVIIHQKTLVESFQLRVSNINTLHKSRQFTVAFNAPWRG